MRTVGREAKKQIPDNTEELKKEIKSLKAANAKLSKRVEELEAGNKKSEAGAD